MVQMPPHSDLCDLPQQKQPHSNESTTRRINMNQKNTFQVAQWEHDKYYMP